jgi:hypothetical protein
VSLSTIFTEWFELKLRRWWEPDVSGMIGANVESSQDPLVFNDDVTVSIITKKASFGAQNLAGGIFHDQNNAVDGRAKNKVLD